MKEELFNTHFFVSKIYSKIFRVGSSYVKCEIYYVHKYHIYSMGNGMNHHHRLDYAY